MQEVEQLKKTVPYFMDKADNTIDKTTVIRDKMIESMSDVVLNMKWDPDADSVGKTEVKVGMMNSLDSLLKNQEKVRLNRAKLSLQDKTNEFLQDVSRDLTAILPKINLQSLLDSRDSLTGDEMDTVIEQAFKESGLTIKSAELEDDPTK